MIRKENSVPSNKIIQRSGIVGGNLKEDIRVCTPKNQGKSNETTGEEQANMEMLSKAAEKVKKEYFYTEQEARDNANAIYPMLAKDFTKEMHKIDWSQPVFIQPKLDGMRCLAFVEAGVAKLVSRTGSPIITVPHILKACRALPDGVYDGELYAPGISFQQNMRLIKKYRKGETESVLFNTYDFVADERFSKRYEMLSKRLPTTAVADVIKSVPTYQLDQPMIRKFHMKFVEAGFEGSILRWGDAPYKSKGRSDNLLKYKDFLDMNSTIRDVVGGENAPDQGILVLGQNGKSFKASIKGTHAYRAEVLANKRDYIGKVANIRYFEETDDGIPRFPVCVQITS